MVVTTDADMPASGMGMPVLDVDVTMRERTSLGGRDKTHACHEQTSGSEDEAKGDHAFAVGGSQLPSDSADAPWTDDPVRRRSDQTFVRLAYQTAGTP